MHIIVFTQLRNSSQIQNMIFFLLYFFKAGGIVLYSAFGDEFRANRPFLYFIRDTQQNTVIFSGRVVELGKK